MDSLFLLGFSAFGINFGLFGDMVIGVLGFVVAFGLAVFIHELGHFLAAKLFKVPVERFVIGMDREAMGFLPRCIWERKIGETVYGISLVPLGGYVKMAGVVHPDIERYLEGEDAKKGGAPIPATAERADGPPRPAASTPSLQEQAIGDMAALYRKPFWQKVIIYGAGVCMNLVLAMGVVTFMFTRGFEESAPYPVRVAWIAPDSPLAGTALQPGDWVVGLNGESTPTPESFWGALAKLTGGKQLGSQELPSVTFTLNLERRPEGAALEKYDFPVTLEGNAEYTGRFLDAISRMDAYVDFVQPNTPAAKAGMEHGDRVLSIDGTPVADWAHFRHIVTSAAGRKLDVVVERKGREVTLQVTPWEDAENPGRGQVGVIVGNARKEVVREPFLTAVASAPGRVYNYTVNYVSRLKQLGGKLTQGNVTAVRRELGGPVGIAQVAYKMAQKGFDDWLRFLIVLNVALAVMNILPFPVLDGGHICFALYEAVFRRPMPPQILVPLLNGAVIFIIIFFVLVTFNDVLKIFT